MVAIVAIVSIVWLSYLYTANADQYKTLGIKHQSIPLTCIFEPHPAITDYPEDIIQAAESAVDGWESMLRTHSSGGVWSLYTKVVPIESHHLKSPYDFPQCDILISFEYTMLKTVLDIQVFTLINHHINLHMLSYF